jgi:signal transduction histidine kinase/CheY-like chemotaxis protein
VERIKIDRMILIVESLAAVAFIVESFILGWEFYLPPLVGVAIIALWFVHITQRFDAAYRLVLYFICGMLIIFFHGIHRTSYFDIAVISMLFMAVFALIDKKVILNIILLEFFGLVGIQIYLQYGSDIDITDSLAVSRLLLHCGIVVCMYVFCRLSVTHRIADRDRIERREREIEKYDTDMEDFLSNISHELRTPVNVVNGMTTIMLKDKETHEVLSIRQAGIRLSYQIEDIQDYTEIKRGELALEEENYMSTSLINDVVALFNQNDRKDELELVVDIDPMVPAMMKGDIRKLHKLFRHLLDNAIKFTKEGGIYVGVSTKKREYGVNLTIEVSDMGIGMTRDEIANVSKGMYQANKKRNRSTGGIGIGLPIVYGFVHKMGGFVLIESRKGEGTTVRLSIPQEVIDPAPCLTVDPDFSGSVVFYDNPTKYVYPKLREFYNTMAITLALGLRVHLFSAGDIRELKTLVDALDVSHVFMGQDEYEDDWTYVEKIAEQGIVVSVSDETGLRLPPGSRVNKLTPPLYGLPIVKALNQKTGYKGLDDIEEIGNVTFPGIKTLIVDDEPMNLVVATGLFKEYKLDTDTAESGIDALNKYIISEFDYDLIFMDHMMPEMDGVETMHRLRNVASDHGRHPIIIALTANALSGAKEMFIREGFDGFIAKPIDIADFERVMKRVLPDNMICYEGREDK